ncbi:unnamed protein product, partial [Staurois parvus]
VVQVRCRALNESGYWSDWSDPISPIIKDIRAPVKGPEFWRIVQSNHLQKGDNITLKWQPVKDPFLCSPVEYEVLYEKSDVVISSIYIGNSTNYTFALQNSVVTVTTVRAHNALGHSSMNRNLLLSQRMSTVQAVESLEVHPLNKSVVAVWSLLPVEYKVLEFVLEWKNLRDESHVRWEYIPPNVSRYYIKDHFFTIEKYQFSLTPVFLEGVGSPKITYEFSK